MGLFIPTDKISNLRLYKYSSEDHSLISKYVLKRWWNYFVQIFPYSMAPNLITLLGLVWILIDLMLVFYYDPYFNETSPTWIYFFYAFSLFMYQTFDGCDGCHARRTGQSGPLGELFDHSIDAINTTLGSLVFASVFKLGYGPLTMLGQFASVCNFYASTWEEYHTHTLFLSKFSGPVEGILMICCVYLITGVFGPDLWTTKLFDLDLSAIGYGIYEVNLSFTYVVIGLSSLYFNIISTMKNVSKYYKKLNTGNPMRAQKQIDNAYKGLVPFFIYYSVVIFVVWNYPEMLSVHAVPLMLSIGCTIAFSVGRMIVAHLTLQQFPYAQFPMFVPIAQYIFIQVCLKVFGYDYDKVLFGISWAGFGITLAIHGMFVAEIIYEITTYLDIYVLTIKHKKH